MAIIVSVNFEEKLVLLEDGRELKIDGFYARQMFPEKGPLTAGCALLDVDRVEDFREAEVFTVPFPGTDAALIVEMGALGLGRKSDIN